MPKTKTQYWIERLELNKKRDFINKNKLIKTKESLYGDNHNFICANFSDPNELQKKITENKINKNYYFVIPTNYLCSQIVIGKK